jgi:hypothetical protein
MEMETEREAFAREGMEEKWKYEKGRKNSGKNNCLNAKPTGNTE